MSLFSRTTVLIQLLKATAFSFFLASTTSAFAGGGRVVQTDDLPNFGSVRGFGILWGGTGNPIDGHTPWLTNNTLFRPVAIPNIQIAGQSFSTAFQYENGMISLGSTLTNPSDIVSGVGQFNSGGQRAFVIAAASADYATRSNLPVLLSTLGVAATTISDQNFYAYASGSVNYSRGEYANIGTFSGECTVADQAGPGFVTAVSDRGITLQNEEFLKTICRIPGTTGYGTATRFTWQGMSLADGTNVSLLNSQVAIWDVGTASDGDVDIFLAVGGKTYDELGILSGNTTAFASSAVGGLSLSSYLYQYNSSNLVASYDHFKIRSGTICGVLNEGQVNETCVLLTTTNEPPTTVPLPSSIACLLFGLFLIRKRG
jgi:hypothetical protein